MQFFPILNTRYNRCKNIFLPNFCLCLRVVRTDWGRAYRFDGEADRGTHPPTEMLEGRRVCWITAMLHEKHTRRTWQISSISNIINMISSDVPIIFKTESRKQKHKFAFPFYCAPVKQVPRGYIRCDCFNESSIVS